MFSSFLLDPECDKTGVPEKLRFFIYLSMKNVVQPDNAAEAEALQILLEQNGIRSQAISFHDTAYDGLFQAQYGWGVIRVEDTDYDKAARIIQEWKESSPEELPWRGTMPTPDE